MPPYRHPELGFGLECPEGWEVIEQTSTTSVFGSIDGSRRVRPALNVSWERTSLDLLAFERRALSAQDRELGPLDLLDLAEEELPAGPARRTLALCVQDDVVVLDERRLVSAGGGWTLSGAYPVEDSARVGRILAHAAKTLVIPDEPVAVGVPGDELPERALTLEEWEVLRRLPALPRDPAGERTLAGLRGAGLVVGSEAHPGLEAPLAPAREAELILTLDRQGPSLFGWASGARATLLLPAGETGWRAVSAPGATLPALLARAVGLRPRATRRDREPRLASIAELAAVVGHDPGVESDVLEHWRLEARWAAGPVALLEAFVRPNGWWLVHPRPGGAELRPTSAAELWVHLAALAPSGDSIASPPPSASSPGPLHGD